MTDTRKRPDTLATLDEAYCDKCGNVFDDYCTECDGQGRYLNCIEDSCGCCVNDECLSGDCEVDCGACDGWGNLACPDCESAAQEAIGGGG